MSALADLTPGTWTVDPSHSEVGFVARHLMVSKVRGRFAEVAVSTSNADRDAHLTSPDFFDAATYPQLTFVSTAVTPDSLAGDLTIKDVTRPVTFDLEVGGVAVDPWGNTKAAFEARADVNRKDWGLTWNAALEGGGVLVSDKIAIVLEIQLTKSA